MTLILVAEDDDAIRSFVAEALVDEGYRVSAVADGQAAIDRCSELTPDLVLLDLMMPVVDGFQFLMRRHEGCAAPVIVMSAGFRMKELTAQMHVAEFIEKPFDLSALIAAVGRCIGPALPSKVA